MTIISTLMLVLNLHKTEVYVKEPNPCNVSVERCISKYFPEDVKTATAVFKAESLLDPSKIGYNCKYGNKITSCDPDDSKFAISKDYGLAQINDQHDENPEKFLDLETNLKFARKLYDERGWKPWYAYTTGKYKEFLQ